MGRSCLVQTAGHRDGGGRQLVSQDAAEDGFPVATVFLSCLSLETDTMFGVRTMGQIGTVPEMTAVYRSARQSQAGQTRGEKTRALDLAPLPGEPWTITPPREEVRGEAFFRLVWEKTPSKAKFGPKPGDFSPFQPPSWAMRTNLLHSDSSSPFSVSAVYRHIGGLSGRSIHRQSRPPDRCVFSQKYTLKQGRRSLPTLMSCTRPLARNRARRHLRVGLRKSPRSPRSASRSNSRVGP